MSDAMDDAFADDEDEDEEENVLGSVLQELGVDLENKMAAAGSDPMQAPSQGQVAAPQAAVAAGGDGGGVGGGGGGEADLDDELQKRLDNLRRT